MCVIAAKAKGIKMPDKATIENMWYNNPDGAGFMYMKDGKVRIEKGFMTLFDLEKALDRVNEKTNLDETAVVLHFRIATHGGITPSNTHPFPVSSSIGMLQKLSCSTSLGVAHNGIIDITPRKGVSDTMEYVATQLAPLYKGVPKFYLNKNLMEMVDNAIKSKLAIMNGDGELYTIGKFEEDNGILYSNTSYKPYSIYGKYWKSKWDDLYGDFDDDDPSCYRYKEDRLLRWFDFDEDVTCMDSKGKWIDNYEYDLAVDSDGHLYRYDYNVDGFVKISGARAYDKFNRPIYANTEEEDYKLMTMESVYEFEPYIIANDKTKGDKSKK